MVYFDDILIIGDAHVGTNFRFAFPVKERDHRKCECIVTPLADAVLHIEAPVAGYDEQVAIAEGTSWRHEFDCDQVVAFEKLETKAIAITSDVEVKVEIIVLDSQDNGDAYLVLPVHEEFTEFVTATYFNPGTRQDWTAAVIVVATQPDTSVSFYM